MNKKFILVRIISGIMIELSTFIFSEVPRIKKKLLI